MLKINICVCGSIFSPILIYSYLTYSYLTYTVLTLCIQTVYIMTTGCIHSPVLTCTHLAYTHLCGHLVVSRSPDFAEMLSAGLDFFIIVCYNKLDMQMLLLLRSAALKCNSIYRKDRYK